MSAQSIKTRKVAIVGAGDVGATFAYALMRQGVAEEIALLDLNKDQAEGQVLDLAHGLPFVPPVDIHVGSDKDYADANVIVVTAGAKQKPGETRLELLQRNADIMRQIMGQISKENENGIVVVVSNPVDILTRVALETCAWPRNRIIGSGTVLDSARFRYFLSQHCDVDARNVHAYILGEHGDSEFAAWSMANIAGMPMADFCPICGKCDDWENQREIIVEKVRKSAYHVINYKGSTYFAVGLALVRIVSAILRNEDSVLTVSVQLEGEFGLKDVCLSVPCLVGSNGVTRILAANLDESEMDSLLKSAAILKETMEKLKG